MITKEDDAIPDGPLCPNPKEGTLIVKTEGAIDDIPVKGSKKCQSPKGNSRSEPHFYGAGAPSTRVGPLLEDAAKTSNVNLSDLVDEIRIVKGDSNFDVDLLGNRIISINEGVFKNSREIQLLEGIHEIIHAQRYNNILKANNGNFVKAFDDYFLSKGAGTELYFLEEVSTETFAFRRLEKYLGSVSDQTRNQSNCYVNEFFDLFKNIKK